MAKTRFARYLKAGDIVWHSGRKAWARLTEVNIVPTDTGDRVGGWSQPLDGDGSFSWGTALGAADSLVIVRN